MGPLGLFTTFVLFWGNFLFIAATRRDICDRCVKIDECPTFANMNTRQQQIWLEQVPCKGPNNAGGPSVFGFSPVAKGDYVCCPNSNIWGMETGDQDQSQKPMPIRPNDRRRPGYPMNGQQNYNGNPQSGFDMGRGMQNPYGQPAGNPDGGIYGNPQNGPNNQGNFGNMPNQNYPQFPNNGNNFLGYPQNGQYPQQNGQYPNGQFPNYPGQTQMPGNPGQNGWGNGNFNQGGNYDQQCPAHTDMMPEPSSGCCGKDMSETNTITDLQKILNRYAPSNSYKYPRPSYSPQQSRHSYPFFRQRRSADLNDTSDDELQNRIAGGKETELDQFPWTVLLKITFDYGDKQAAFSCGGSLISQRYILTAGHCVYEEGGKVVDVEITLAEYDKRTFPRDCISEMGGSRECIDNIRMQAEDVIHHPEYDDEQLHNDIALIKIRGYAPYTRFIRPVCLPPLDIDDPDLSNLPLAVAGWGRNGQYETNIKQSTVVHLVPHDKCVKSYPQLTVSHLCAAGRTGEDTCKGDSGGPLMMLYGNSYYVIGVVSGKRADSPCGTSVPSLYTNVYQYVPWIMSNTRN